MSPATPTSEKSPDDGSPEAPILTAGRNCWRVARAERVAVLVDAERYFAALADALERARHRVFLIGWDFHSRVRLRRSGSDDDRDSELAAFLDALARRRRKLRIHVLEWDFSLIYLPEREALRAYRFAARTHRRVKFRFDAEHPIGGSHHQKMVVIDDAVAFSGGIDITSHRWDTREHTADEPRRTNPDGHRYAPFHDIQAAVDGEAARALGELARERWHVATGKQIDPVTAEVDPWPPSLEPQLRGVDVGIARTRAAYGGAPAVREVEALYRESIAAARRWIYIENQYLTARRMAEDLAQRLREPDGPEVVIVLPERCSGWLEEGSMGVLRDQFLRLLREADAHDRLQLYHPRVPGLGASECVNVHAKLMVVDDRLLRVGSANLANRSMGLDSECDLAFEARPAEQARSIAGIRDDLLAEHLGVPTNEVTETLAATGSLVRAVEALRGGPRTLVPVSETSPEWNAELAERFRVFDPERPLDVHELLPQMGEVPDIGVRSPTLFRAAALAGIAGLALALWRFTPLAELVTPTALAGLGEALRGSALGALASVALMGLACLAFVPVTAMIVACGLVFPPGVGFAIALAGSTLGAALGYGLGRGLWRDAVHRLAGQRFRGISKRLRRRGILATATVRIVPIAPFGVVNLVAGASHVRLRDFLVGTVLAMAPGTAVLVFASDRILRAVSAPDAGTIVTAIAAAAGAAAVVLALRRWGPFRSGDASA